MFLDHHGRRPVRRLEWRVRLLGVGAILAFVGLYFEARWMIWGAIGVLAVGFLMRMGSRGEEDGSDEDDPQRG
jgi:hypothetical protein